MRVVHQSPVRKDHGQRATSIAARRCPRHCEERSDEAIQPSGVGPFWIASLRRIASAVRAVTGVHFHIFHDSGGIGEHWPGKLDQMLEEARFFIPDPDAQLLHE
jgi:hypothetical protein